MTDYKQLYYELYGDIVTASQVLEKLIKKNQARFLDLADCEEEELQPETEEEARADILTRSPLVMTALRECARLDGYLPPDSL